MIIPDQGQALKLLATEAFNFGATATHLVTTISARMVRINTTAAVCVDLLGTGASTATCARMSADQTEYFQSTPGVKIGVVAADSSAAGDIGTIYVSEC